MLRPEGWDGLRAERAAWAERVAPAAVALGLRPPELEREQWRELLAACYPLHPMTLAALPWLLQQLGQHERSLLALLHGEEPHGLRDALRGAPAHGPTPIYRLTQLYAYVEARGGPGRFDQAQGRRWAALAEARALLGDAFPHMLAALTVVGMIGALEGPAGLRASREQVAFALADATDNAEAEQVWDALDALERRGLIAYRRDLDCYLIRGGGGPDRSRPPGA